MSGSGWGVQYTLTVPTEEAARDAASELARHGHRLVAVRPHRSSPFELAAWYGEFSPKAGEGLAGWWQVFSLAVYVAAVERGGGFAERLPAVRPYLNEQARYVAEVARSRGGFSDGCAEGHESTLEKEFDRTGLLHEGAGALHATDGPASASASVPVSGAPPWVWPEPGDPAVLVAAVVEVAERVYGSAENAPEAVAWLLDEDFAFGEPYESAADFLADLDDAVAHQGTALPGTAEAVPFLVAVATEPAVPVTARVLLLVDLLRHSTAGVSDDVALADRNAALGRASTETEAQHAVRHAVRDAVPRLLARWDEASDAERFVLAALAAAHRCGEGPDVTASVRRSDLDALAPAGTDRADTVALIEALLRADETAVAEAVGRLATRGLGEVRGLHAGPHARTRDVGVVVLSGLVMRDVGRDLRSL
ncbi:hypothetical protein [Streptomyces sp. NPDC029674]|uniref:hypothetical protein n=1 Tax=Streptomyces sp. NPDC029674 TaxID=3365297 RepID=UPI003850C985